MSNAQAPGPLAGIRVIDLTRALSGPYATLMMADAGAEVIKVERPDGGDDSRGWGPPFLGDGDDRESSYFLSVNRNKLSVTLNLKDPDDVAVLRDLLVDADVLVENFRPGVMERLGLGPQALAALNDRLVVLSITGFGEGGPDGHRSGFDQIVQGEAGLMAMTGHPGGQPTRFGVPITDILSGMFGAWGVVTALYERERTGRGQRVTTSLLASAVAVHAYQGTRWTLGGDVVGLEGNRHASIAPYGAFRCADGWINIAVGSEGLWARFAPTVGIDADDSRFATNHDRVTNWDDLEEAINRATTTATVAEWMARMDDAGVPAGRINTMDQVYELPQVHHVGAVAEVEHPTAGHLRLPGSPVQWSDHDDRPTSPPPRLGEHNEAVRRAAGRGTGERHHPG
ncbi:MAG TPA: CoA transferase [Nitriliruptoraceae bacterium]|nr:CoA transferase [Nitriliruptoraceae bacterium]